MALFKNGGFVPDDWRPLEPGEDVPPSGKVLLTVAQWMAWDVRTAFGDAPLGLLIEPGQDLEALASGLDRLAMLAVAFPKFTDGRGYSLARKLRGHYGYKGELRARGDILFDQLQLLARCGFDSFEIKDPATIRLLEAGRKPFFSIYYQPGAGGEAQERSRRWARRAAL
jgi:phosphoadenosine phosphosulfate reductase